jgi:hypothetical protein
MQGLTIQLIMSESIVLSSEPSALELFQSKACRGQFAGLWPRWTHTGSRNGGLKE